METEIRGEWATPGAAPQRGVLEWEQHWTLTLGEGRPQKGTEDLGDGVEDEILPVVFGTDARGRLYTLVGVKRDSQADWRPSEWSIVKVWRGMHSAAPESEPVAAMRVSGSTIANLANRSLAPESPPYRAVVPGATVTIPETRKMAGWTRIAFDTTKPLDEAEEHAWNLVHLEALVCGTRAMPPLMHAVLPDGREAELLQRRERIAKPLVDPSDFAGGFEQGIREWWRICEEMPLVVERWLTALERQPVLSQAHLITTSLQPLYDALNPPAPDDEAWAERKARILEPLHEDDRGFVAARLPRKPPRPSIREMADYLLQPISSALSLDDDERRTVSGNLEDLRTELVHRTGPLYSTMTRYLELARMANLGITLIMYHLWTEIGVDERSAATAVGEFWATWLTWVLPSSRVEPLGDRRKRR